MNIKSLKDKILQLAIQGKLVPQNEEEGPASVLLEKIKLEKEQLIKDKKMKKEKLLPDISDEDKAFDTPKGWIWCRFGNATICRDGDRVPISSKDREDRVKIYDYYGASGVIDKIDDYLFDKSLLLIGEDGANLISRSTPIAFIAQGKYWVNNHAHVIDSLQLVTLKYLEIYINAIDLKPFVTGTAQPKLNQANLNQIPIMLAPLEEQKRIVAKIEELFELIDELDSNKQDLLDNITNSRNKVLQLAIQGKLVEQCENDEPATILLERIKEEKEQLIKDKSIKKEKPLPEISDEEKVLDLPKGWQWCRLGEIINISSGKISQKSMCEGGTIPVYGGNGITGYHNDYNVSEKTIVIGRVGFYCGSIHLTEEKAWVTDNAFITKYSKNNISRKFLLMILNGTNLKGEESSTAQPVISGKKIYPIVIPLPPLEEQKRIVAKVDLIMDYLDKLQQEIQSQEIILEDILQ